MYNLIFIPMRNKEVNDRGLFFIEQFSREEFVHGGITCVDVEKVLRANGFAAVSLPYHHDFSIRAKIARFIYVLKTVATTRRGSRVAFLFPVYARLNRVLLRLLQLRGARLICIIADIEGMRDGDPRLRDQEFRLFRRWKYFVVHNKAMDALIRQQVPGAVCGSINLFDYLASPCTRERKLSRQVVFAGNLAKSGFVAKLDQLGAEVVVNLYGPGMPDEARSFSNIHYFGVFKPYDMPATVEGAFGLVWDGDSLETCNGSYGEYLRVNSQHKLSLYILAGLPVIIWSGAATARIVSGNKIGIVVDSLREMPAKIGALTEDEYHQMRINMQGMAEKISQGQNLSLALDNLLKGIV